MKKIKLLGVILLILCSPVMTQSKRIRNINSFKIPKGYNAIYDEFTDTIHIKQKNDIYADTHGKNVLDISFIISNNVITDTVIDIEYYEPSNLLTTSTTVFIKNESIHKYHIEWENSVFGNKVEPIQLLLSGITKSYFMEKNKTTNLQLRNFLMDNLKVNSEILIRFHGYEVFDKRVPKKYTKELSSAVEFYKNMLKNIN